MNITMTMAFKLTNSNADLFECTTASPERMATQKEKQQLPHETYSPYFLRNNTAILFRLHSYSVVYSFTATVGISKTKT